jgi:predicted transcriptional regulator
MGSRTSDWRGELGRWLKPFLDRLGLGRVKTKSDLVVMPSGRQIFAFFCSPSQHGEGALSMAVLDVATHAIVTVAPGDSLKRATSLMTNHRVRHLPVIANGNPVGIVSIGDVVKLRLEDLETESNVLRDVYIAAR